MEEKHIKYLKTELKTQKKKTYTATKQTLLLYLHTSSDFTMFLSLSINGHSFFLTNSLKTTHFIISLSLCNAVF